MVLSGSGWPSSSDDALRNVLRGGSHPFRLYALQLDAEQDRAKLLQLTAGSTLPGDEEIALLSLSGAQVSLSGAQEVRCFFSEPAEKVGRVQAEKIFGEQGALFLKEHPEALGIWRFLAKTDLVHSPVNLSSLTCLSNGPDTSLHWQTNIRALGARWTFTFLPGGQATFSLELPEEETVGPALSIVTEAAMEASAEEPLRLVLESNAKGLPPGMARYQSSIISVLPVLESILSRLHREGTVDFNSRSDDFRFHLPRVTLTHQDNDRCVDVFVSYRYDHTMLAGSYPDFLNLRRNISEALHSYPNRSDYWESVNHALVQMLLKRYPCLHRVAITLEVHPDSSVPFFRASTVAVCRRHLPLGCDEKLN